MKKFIPVLLLLLIALGFCVAGDAITVPPWWMIGQSATENGAATFTVPITTTGKATVGTLESGAATFTGNIALSGQSSPRFSNVEPGLSNIFYDTRYNHYLCSNAYYSSNSWGKHTTASPSLVFATSPGSSVLTPIIYTSDAGNSNPLQNGPFNMWHGGMSTFISANANTYYAAGTSDGSDNRYLALGNPDVSRGSFVMTTGNEYSTVGGSLYLQAGNNSSGSILLRTADTNRFIITYGGDIRFYPFAGGGTTGASLDNEGDLIRTPSDLRLKEDITDITAGLDKVRAMRGVTFNWKDKASFGSRRDYGMIAQEVEAVIPEVVTQNPDGMKSLDYQKIVPVLVEAIKDQQRIIESQGASIAALESRINALEGK